MNELVPKKKRVFGLPQKREEAVTLLNHCYAKNLLELDEFENRLELVEKAKTLDELDDILSDIPDELKKIAANRETPVSDMREHEDFRCTFSYKTVSFPKLCAKKLDIKARFGSVVMDYHRQQLPAGVLDVRLDAKLTNFYITLPPDARIETDVDERFSNIYEGRSLAKAINPPRTIIRLKGKIGFSSIYIEMKTPGSFADKVGKFVAGLADKFKNAKK